MTCRPKDLSGEGRFMHRRTIGLAISRSHQYTGSTPKVTAEHIALGLKAGHNTPAITNIEGRQGAEAFLEYYPHGNGVPVFMEFLQ